MSVLVIVAAGWIALSVALALLLARTVRVAETRKENGAFPLSSGPFPGEALLRIVDPAADVSRGSSRQ